MKTPLRERKYSDLKQSPASRLWAGCCLLLLLLLVPLPPLLAPAPPPVLDPLISQDPEPELLQAQVPAVMLGRLKFMHEVDYQVVRSLNYTSPSYWGSSLAGALRRVLTGSGPFDGVEALRQEGAWRARGPLVFITVRVEDRVGGVRLALGSDSPARIELFGVTEKGNTFRLTAVEDSGGYLLMEGGYFRALVFKLHSARDSLEIEQLTLLAQ